MKRVYLAMMVIGTILPLYFFIGYFAEQGFDLLQFVRVHYANRATAGTTTDLLLSIVTAWVFSANENRRLGLRKQWLIIVATFLVGLSLALPLLLYLRETKAEAQR